MLNDLKINLKEPSNTIGCPKMVARFPQMGTWSKIKRLKFGSILNVFQGGFSEICFNRSV